MNRIFRIRKILSILFIPSKISQVSNKIMSTTQVYKMGGNELADPAWLDRFARTMADLPGRKVIVHGGGRMIAEMQARLGIRTQIVDGLRVTDAETLDVAQMVMSGRVNKLLVAALLKAGVQAIGLSGVDGGLLRCRQKIYAGRDLGLVGEIEGVRTGLLHLLLDAGWTPVISPISLGADGQAYNVNADEAAGMIAGAVAGAMFGSSPDGSLTIITNTPGVLDGKGEVMHTLALAQARELAAKGIIRGGMMPKVQAALMATEQGVRQARIVDLAGLAGAGGTVITADAAGG